MRKNLIVITSLIFATALIVNFINGRHHVARFKACPNTEYCSELGKDQQSDPVRIEYSGWPFKVKIGNPDWCEKDACEVNNFHPDNMWEFLVYNAIILSLPSALLFGVYIYRYKPSLARQLMVKLAVLTISVALGWWTVTSVTSTIIWHNTPKGSSISEAYAGIPFHETFSGADVECVDTDCVQKALGDYPLTIWHSDVEVYLNWVFWSLIWVLIFLFPVRKLVYHKLRGKL